MLKYFLATTMILLLSSPLYAANNDDRLSGYIEGIIYKAYNISPELEVREGVVYITNELAENPSYEEIKNDILAVEGVKDVRITEDMDFLLLETVSFLPGDRLFKPLLADIRWPRFSAGYNYHSDYSYYRSAFDASFGKDFAVVRLSPSTETTIEIGLQAAAFVTFDLGTPTFALINTDYMFGVPLTVQRGKTAVIARVYHLSSHLGDDYMKDQPLVENRDITYEKFDILVEHRPEDWARLYGGLGSMISKSPNDIQRFSYQFGFELYKRGKALFHPDLFLATDIKGFQETGYTPCYSVKTGVIIDEVMVLSADFYSGDSPHGQFYVDRVTWFGASLSLYI